MGQNKQGKKPWGVVIANLFLVMVAIYLVAYSPIFFGKGAMTQAPQPFTAVPEAVDFTAVYEQGFIDLGNGESATFADFKGKPFVLNFWATWCAPCLKELPSLETLHKSGRVNVVTLSLDRFADPETILNFAVQRAGVEMLPLYWDNTGQINRTLKPKGLPLTLFINEQGQAIGAYEGDYDWSGFSYEPSSLSSNKER